MITPLNSPHVSRAAQLENSSESFEGLSDAVAVTDPVPVVRLADHGLDDVRRRIQPRPSRLDDSSKDPSYQVRKTVLTHTGLLRSGGPGDCLQKNITGQFPPAT